MNGNILLSHGWPSGRIIGLALAAARQLNSNDTEALTRLNAVRANPGAYLADTGLGDLARECLRSQSRSAASDDLKDQPLPYQVWGRGNIQPEAIRQMEAALRLPISAAGALMPDAHAGYGLPIGGVLATYNSIIPYAVGVDIACRMRLSLYAVSPIVIDQHRAFGAALLDWTRFGKGAAWSRSQQPDDEILSDHLWQATPLLRSLRDTAAGQLATSGSGNHFVEWGEFDLTQPDECLNLPPGRYLGLLSHSGSRGIGFKIANHYSQLAQREHPRLDPEVKHLAWLDLDSELGAEYWLSMQLAGRFAAANHRLIHQRVAQAVGLHEAAAVENHHNYGWAEQLPNGDEVIVHRKGATPAGPGVLGVIPGSMGDAGYLVRGLGSAASINSASHGAGRAMSRTQAFKTFTAEQMARYLAERRVTLLGGGLDESPMAYKPIDEVMFAQRDLVEVLGRFAPRIVRMAGEAGED